MENLSFKTETSATLQPHIQKSKPSRNESQQERHSRLWQATEPLWHRRSQESRNCSPREPRHIRCLRPSPPKREGHHKESIGVQKEHSPRSDRRRPTSPLRRSYRKKRPPILFRSTQAWLRG